MKAVPLEQMPSISMYIMYLLVTYIYSLALNHMHDYHVAKSNH